jgi:hypothetical protein
MGTDKAKRVELRVFACGTSEEPPVDLDCVGLRSTLKAEWVGTKEEGLSEDGLRIQSRRLPVLLDPAGPAGGRRAEILLQDGEQAAYRHVVSWEAVSAITASPKVMVIKPGDRRNRVVVQSRDWRSFRITPVECEAPGIRGRATSNAAAVSQAVEIEREVSPPAGSARGVVMVFTDHPAQGKVAQIGSIRNRAAAAAEIRTSFCQTRPDIRAMFRIQEFSCTHTRSSHHEQGTAAQGRDSPAAPRPRTSVDRRRVQFLGGALPRS